VSASRLPPLTLNAWLRYDALERIWPADAVRVLEVGCGQGALGARLAARCDYVGLEPDPVSAAVATRRLQRLGRGQIRQLDVAGLDPAERYDVVCAFEVIEHLQDDRAALEQWARHLRPGGMLILSTPADPARFGPADAAVGHVRRYQPAQLARLLAELELVQVHVTRYGAPLGYALEAGRNVVARRTTRRTARRGSTRAGVDRTAASGRWHQPPAALSLAVQAATVPFRSLQHRLPDRGPGLLATARQPI
jgi:SAM-dependent methyltransferase